MASSLVAKQTLDELVRTENHGERTRAVLSYHAINDGGLDRVDNVVACAGDEMSVETDFYFRLRRYDLASGLYLQKERLRRTLWAYSSVRVWYLSSRSQALMLVLVSEARSGECWIYLECVSFWSMRRAAEKKRVEEDFSDSSKK